MDSFETVRRVIRDRVTSKMLGDPACPVTHDSTQLDRFDAIVQSAVEESGWAPFHYDRGAQGVSEPWRVHWVKQSDCHALARDFADLLPHLKPGNKMPQLLAGCGCLVLFNWLPVDRGEEPKWESVNREHLAATAAMVQNFLLLLTAAGLPSYWSSGGLLAGKPFECLGISSTEQLLAAVFVHYPDGKGSVNHLEGKQRARRSPAPKWFAPARYERSS